MNRHLLLLLCVFFLGSALPAQDETVDRLDADAEPRAEPAPLPPEPMTPREELFLAIELKDVDAARRALRRGADAEVSIGDPSPLGTAALHNDLRMVVLLLDFGADPGATGDSPLEEAIRNENVRMVKLFLQAGARVPAGARGEELFRLAQRGTAARELSAVLLDHGGNPDLCLAAAARAARVEMIEHCLERGADVGSLPEDLNILGIALRSGDAGFVERVVAEGLEDRVVAGALGDAIEAGNMDLVRQAVTRGAKPGFAHVEAAIVSGRPEICLFLLDQTPPEDPSIFAGGDAAELIQRSDDLGLDELSAALRRKSGLHAWTLERVLPPLLGGLVAIALLMLVARNLRRPKTARVAVGSTLPPHPAAAPAPRRPPRAAAPAPAPAEPAARPPAARAPAARPPAAPAAAATAEPPAAAFETVVLPSAPAGGPSPAPAGPSVPGAPASPAAAPVDDAWEIVPEPAETPEAGAPTPEVQVSEGAAGAVELRMPEVDLEKSAEQVFDSARRAAGGEAVRPDAPDRRQVVLVTPARVALLRSCPAPGSLSPADLAVAEGIAPAAEPKNVAVIAFNDLEAMEHDVARAIPFFDLLAKLGYLGHAVWIFEGHVSAMAAGCRDADLLIVDDGMMPYLPGNWRSVASRSMRGEAIYLFERRAGTLRRLG